MKKWRFLSNQNSQIVGINDAGIETFTANMNRSLIREIIQNSLDAVIEGCKEPVIVEFVKFQIPTENMPDIDGFRDVIRKCKYSNQNEPDAVRFFENAETVLSQATIDVLRISDYRTRGLEGAETCEKGTSWSRLVKESGSSNKNQTSGGSFGIGKAAAFACSDLRTIFYSSKDIGDFDSNFGVAKLVSFEDKYPGDWTTGIGYYSMDERFVAIRELAKFDRDYSREDSGTDIYILGMHSTDDFKEEFIKSVLLDFLISIVNKKLIVRIQDEEINSISLPKYMSKLNQYESEEIKNLLEYYDLLKPNNPGIIIKKLDSKKYGKKYGFQDGECTLYLKEGEGLNRKILITRRAGMRILEQNRISGSIDFTGILIIDGDNMNESFRRMEVPSHDAWEPGRVRGEEKKYTGILQGLKSYLRNMVKEEFAKVATDKMDALGASDFLPDKPIVEDNGKLQKDEMSTRIKNIKEKVIKPSNSQSKLLDIIEDNSDYSDEGSGKGEEPVNHSTDVPHPGPVSGTNEGNQGGRSSESEGENGYKKISVRKRLICSNVNLGVYHLTLTVPFTTTKSKLQFSLSGEQSNYSLPVIKAKILKGNSHVNCVKGNNIILENLKEGEVLKLEVQVDFYEYCMMEVDYYAFKK